MRKRLNCFSLFLIIIALSFLSGSEKAGSPPTLLDKTEISDDSNDVAQVVENMIKENESTKGSDAVAPDANASDTSKTNTDKTNSPNHSNQNNSRPGSSGTGTVTFRLSEMSLEEKVKQMLIPCCSDINTARSAAKFGVGGVCLFAGVFQNQNAIGVRAQMNGLQEAAQIPLFIGVDEEGGTVCRVSSNPQLRPSRFLSPSALYAQGSWGLIESDTREKAQLLLGLGINFNFAPVCDVPLSTQNYIYPRCFSTDANLTSQYVSLVVRVMKEQGIGSSLKHFPGYGGNSDTHAGIAYDYRSRDEFRQSDFLPFASGISAGASSVMVSHNIVTCMDSNLPASLSPEVHRILREELSFDGVIMSDDLNMQAITQFTGGNDAAVQAILAGNDIILCGTSFERSAAAIVTAVENGTISQAQIDASVLRILHLKEQLNLNIRVE